MVFSVYKVEKDKSVQSDSALKDDLIARQSITVRDATVLGLEENVKIIMIEGTQEAIDKADELLKDLSKKVETEEAKAIQKKIKSADDEAAEGVGMIFG